MRSPHRVALSSLVALAYPRSVAGWTKYKSFFPDYEEVLTDLVNGNCSGAYEALTQHRPVSSVNPIVALWGKTDTAFPLIECILDAAPESVKADFSSAQVLLGLMPTILNNLGPSSQELSVLLVLGDRQLLAMLLALGSPFTNNNHSFGYARQIDALSRSDGDASSMLFRWQASVVVLHLEYLIAFAAIANIAELSYEIAIKVSSTISQGKLYLPGLWVVLGFAAHLLVAIAFRLRVRVEDSPTSEGDNQLPWNLAWMTKWTSRQFNAIDEDSRGLIKLRPATVSYTMLSLFTKAFIVAHMGFGVLTFSSIMFVGIADAVGIFFRYFASVFVCRLVVANEIAVLKMTAKQGVEARRSRPSDRTSQGDKNTDYQLAGGPDLPHNIY